MIPAKFPDRDTWNKAILAIDLALIPVEFVTNSPEIEDLEPYIKQEGDDLDRWDQEH